MDAVEELARAGRAVVERRLTWGTAGNVSVRAGGEFHISAAGTVLSEIDAEHVACCAVEGDGWTGARPSVEAGLHRAIYAARPDVGAIVHASPFHATLVAASEVAVDARATTDTAYYVRNVVRVPFAVPGSPELARAACRAAAEADVILLDNHGCLCLAPTLAEAVNRTDALELLCRVLVAEALGFPLRRLTPEQAEGLRDGGHQT